jgi:hypothetical protein
MQSICIIAFILFVALDNMKAIMAMHTNETQDAMKYIEYKNRVTAHPMQTDSLKISNLSKIFGDLGMTRK